MRAVARGSGVLVAANQGLKDGGLIKAFRDSNIMNRYTFKDEVIRQTPTRDFVTRLERGLGDREFRGQFPSYLRQIDRQLQSGFNGGEFGMGIRIYI